MKLSRLLRRDPARPTIAERAAGLKNSLTRVVRRETVEATPSRRAVVGGLAAASVPLPVIAFASAADSHPDADLLMAGERYERALAVEASTGAALDAAKEPRRAVLADCPPEVFVLWSDRRLILGGMCWPTAVGGSLRAHPVGEDGDYREAWTGEVMRNAIRLAVPRLGRGGQTPHHVRRWKALLPTVDKIDAEVEAVEVATDWRARLRAYYAAQDEVRDATRALRDHTATTPAGLAFVVRLAALDTARGCKPSPNLLSSAAAVAGVDLTTVPAPRPGTF